MRYIITEQMDHPEVQDDKGAKDYLAKLQELSDLDFYTEFRNINVARHSLIRGVYDLEDGEIAFKNASKETFVKDLTEKALLIIYSYMSKRNMTRYIGSDFSCLKILMNQDYDLIFTKLDEVYTNVASLNLKSDKTGLEMLKRLSSYVGKSKPKGIEYSEKQWEIFDLFKDVISKAGIKLSRDSKNFTEEALLVINKVYANLNNLPIYVITMAASEEDLDQGLMDTDSTFAAIAFSSIMTLHAKHLKNGLATLFGLQETASCAELGSIFAHTINTKLNHKEKEILGAISQTIVVGSDSTHQEGSGFLAPLVGGRIFEGTWFTSKENMSDTGIERVNNYKNFSKDDEYPYVGVSYLTFGLNREDKTFDEFYAGGNGYLANKMNECWFLISKMTPMPDSFFKD